MEREQNCFKTDGTNKKSLKPYKKGNKIINDQSVLQIAYIQNQYKMKRALTIQISRTMHTRILYEQ